MCQKEKEKLRVELEKTLDDKECFKEKNNQEREKIKRRENALIDQLQ